MTGSILLASESAETRALAEAITSRRSAPGGTEELAKQMNLLTARCQSYPAETRQLWDWFEAQEPCACVDDDDFRAIFQNHLALLDDRIRLVQQVQVLAMEMGQGNGSLSYIGSLSAALNDLAAQRCSIGGVWERMNAPSPPFKGPQSTREERRAAFERGEYEDIETILERVRNGGPISKD